MVCTMVAINPDITVGWVVCTTIVEFGVTISGIFIVGSNIAIGNIFAVNPSIAASSMVCTSLPLLRVMALAFSFGLILA
ncbi:hypothetical protein NC651_021298 [Populus alba x Populus x berolinensis]|nr:hypothetical protein NC651_021298 [Populus alba x Populus x berolinensis]